MLVKFQGRAENIQGRAPLDFALIHALLAVPRGQDGHESLGCAVNIMLEDVLIPELERYVSWFKKECPGPAPVDNIHQVKQKFGADNLSEMDFKEQTISYEPILHLPCQIKLNPQQFVELKAIGFPNPHQRNTRGIASNCRNYRTSATSFR